MILKYSLVRKETLSERKQMLKQWVHDLQNPVSGIQLISQYLLVDEQESELDKERKINDILLCCADLNRLIDEMYTNIELYY
ncbi:histidine kinase dimerization/phospho-acceptor domain-containing protein [Chitinophagaceae bacterium LWZ2-11]